MYPLFIHAPHGPEVNQGRSSMNAGTNVTLPSSATWWCGWTDTMWTRVYFFTVYCL